MSIRMGTIDLTRLVPLAGIEFGAGVHIGPGVNVTRSAAFEPLSPPRNDGKIRAEG